VNLSEHQEQATVVSWIERNYPEILYFAVPNGASLAGRGRQMNKLKAEGLLPGAADLVILEPRGGWHGALLEMKTETGQLHCNQAWFIAQAEQRHYFTIVAHGAAEAIAMIGDYLGWPTAASTEGGIPY
jgi:hypothetical protein